METTPSNENASGNTVGYSLIEFLTVVAKFKISYSCSYS